MKPDKKTNAMRILESLGIEYEIHRYEVDEDHLDAIHAAESAGLEKEKVFKTIVVRNQEKQLFVFCLPAEFEISMKRARELTGSKDLELVKQDELLSLTGYIRGGCSPLGMKRKYPTFIEETALLEDSIYVSAGVRGMQIELKPEDLAISADAQFADFI